ncbi:unnamed protein product, partial [Symbiodinium necroappetens]
MERTEVWSQPQEDGGGDEAGELILNQYGVPGAWSQPGEDRSRNKAGGLILNQYEVSDRGRDKVRGLNLEKTKVRGVNLKKTEPGTRPECLPSTNIGSRVRGVNLKKTEVRGLNLEKTEVWSHPEEDGGAWSQPGEDGYGDKAGGLILNQYGVPGAWCGLIPKKTEVRGLNLEKTEAGTRPEGLSTTNMGSQVRGLNLEKTEDGYGDKAGGLILKQYGVPGSQVRGLNLEKTEVGTRCGFNVKKRRCLEETAAGTRPEGLSSTNMGSQVRGLNLEKTEDAIVWVEHTTPRMTASLL